MVDIVKKLAKPVDCLDDPEPYGLLFSKSTFDPKGIGLFTEFDIKKNSLICPYNYNKKDVMSFRKFKEIFGRDFRDTYTIAVPYRPWRIVNSKKNKNFCCWLKDGSPHENCVYRRFCLFSKKKIPANTELSLKFQNYKPIYK